MESIIVRVNPGICGFDCIVKAERIDKRHAKIMIRESDCTLIQKLSCLLCDISLQDLFIPLTKNPTFMAAEQAGCHLGCLVPVAIVKACEVALELAIPKDSSVNFEK